MFGTRVQKFLSGNKTSGCVWVDRVDRVEKRKNFTSGNGNKVGLDRVTRHLDVGGWIGWRDLNQIHLFYGKKNFWVSAIRMTRCPLFEFGSEFRWWICFVLFGIQMVCCSDAECA